MKHIVKYIDYQKMGKSPEAFYVLVWANLYGVLFALIYFSVFPSVLFISTLSNALCVKTMYWLLEAGWYPQLPQALSYLMLGLAFLLLYSLMFGHMANTMAYAALAEVLLYVAQFPVKDTGWARMVWCVSFGCVAMTPLVFILLNRDFLKSDVVSPSERVATSLGFETRCGDAYLGLGL